MTMEIIGIVLLLGVFGLGIAFVYLFLQYIELLKAAKSTTEDIQARLKALEHKAGTANPAPQEKQGS